MSIEHTHHGHNHHAPESSKKILFTAVLNIVITAAEIFGGILSGSLALLSDALHNLSDVVSIILSYLANKFSTKKSDLKRTFGYKRLEILAALFNSAALIAVSIYLIYEAILRFNKPQEIDGLIMFVVAFIGLLGNGISVLILKSESHGNLNIKAAYLHLFSDTLSSVGVIIGGVLIYYFHIFVLDPIITILISIYISIEAYGIIKETIDILMQASPSNLDLNDVKIEIEKIPEVKNLHHIHVWRMNDKDTYFEGHVGLYNNMNIKETEHILLKIKSVLNQKYNIDHTTIQFECDTCKNMKLIQSKDNG